MASNLGTTRRRLAEDGSLAACSEEHAGRSYQEFLSALVRHKSGDREVEAGHDIFSVGQQCDAIYIVTEGWAALYDLFEDGRRQILQFAPSGTILRFNPGLGESAGHSAEALTDTRVCTVQRRDLAALAKENPGFGMALAELIAHDRNLAFDHLTSIGRRSARERVARLLLELFIRTRAQWPGPLTREMRLPLTQEHIGDATGLTCVHVNRVLGELRNEGIVEFHYRRLTILNPARLVGIAAIEPSVAASWIPRSVPQSGSQGAASRVESVSGHADGIDHEQQSRHAPCGAMATLPERERSIGRQSSTTRDETNSLSKSDPS